MVYETRFGSPKKKEHNLRSCSADSGVSVMLRKPFVERQSSGSQIDEFEEHLDFEPENELHSSENELHSFQSQSEVEQSPLSHSDQSTFLSLPLNCEDNWHDVDSDYPPTNDICSVTNVSVAHKKYMLPVPRCNAKDSRQNEYLSVFTTSSTSVTLDSSSESGSENIQSDEHIDTDLQNDFIEDYDDHQTSNLFSEDASSIGSPSISQEEEDRLLDSDEEENSQKQNDALLIKTGVETCQIGNACIRLPKFIKDVNYSTNDLKRTKSVAKLKAFRNNNKKKRWDVHYKPEQPITRTFLEDIGYIPEEKIDTRIDKNCVNTSGKLLVVCNKDKIICQQSQEDSYRNNSSACKSNEINFKLPLPPPKRPPTRPKRTVSNSDVSGSNLKIQVSNKEPESITPHRFQLSQNSREHAISYDKDDTISLVASTIMEEDNNQIHNSYNDSDEEEIETPNLDLSNQIESINSRVKEWIKNVPNVVENNKYSNSTSVISQQNLNMVPAVLPLALVSTKGNQRVDFSNVPSVFSGLCYRYFFTKYKCGKTFCKLKHVLLKDKILHKLTTKTKADVFSAFQFSMQFNEFFKEIYSVFINAFGILKMQTELFTSVKYILKMEEINATEALQFVVAALEKSGLTFLDAIDMISFNIGFLEYPVIADVLLDLLTREMNVAENWEVIKRIIKVVGNIRPIILEKILRSITSVYPINRELCVDIYNVIIKNEKTDLSQVNEEILTAFKALRIGLNERSGLQTLTVPKPFHPLPIPRYAQPSTVTNSQELLAEHINQNLIKERECYERQIEGTTIRTTTTQRTVGLASECSATGSNYVTDVTNSCDNQSHGSGSELFPESDFSQPPPPFSPLSCLKNNIFSSPPRNISKANNPICSTDNLTRDILLRFEPPPLPETTNYIPEQFRWEGQRNLHQDDEVALTPSRPIFGKARYRNNFKPGISLHNLLPDSLEHVNINEGDVAKLNSAITAKNGQEFYMLLTDYLKPATIQNFITMTIAHLKSLRENIFDLIVAILKSLETVKPDYATDRQIKGVIEVVVLNILFILEKRGKWVEAKKLLELFCDWDSLVSSKLLQIFSQRNVTPMGRYIFIAKIFVMANDFHYTYEILQCPSLSLLEAPENWPYFYYPNVDIASRNSVLKDFFENGYRTYIIGILDIYRRIFKFGGIHGYDARIHYNPMLTSIINAQQTSLLRHFVNDIEIFSKAMEPYVLRAFTILVADQLSQENWVKLYELCCEKKIYKLYTGMETWITVRNNQYNVELQLMLSYYFLKISQSRKLPLDNLTIEIKLLDNKPWYPKMLQKYVRSIKTVNETIKKILEENFNITASDAWTNQLILIVVPRDRIATWLQCDHQQWFPIYG